MRLARSGALAMVSLASALELGVDKLFECTERSRRDDLQSIAYYEEDTGAMERIALCALRANSDADAGEGLRWLERAAALGAASAINNLATLHAVGHARARVAADGARAAALWERAGEKGDTHAFFNLGRLHETGAPGVASSDAAALAWYRRGAEQGDAPAAHAAAVLLSQQRGLPVAADGGAARDAAVAAALVEAARWFALSAGADSSIGTRGGAGAHAHADDARFMLGLMAIKGEGRPRDVGEAARLLEIAAGNGHEAAGVVLAELVPLARQVVAGIDPT